MKDTLLNALYERRSKMIKENINTDKIDQQILAREQKFITKIFEDDGGGGAISGGGDAGGYSGGVAYANGSNVAGMGPVMSGQPSMYPGIAGDPMFGATGGTTGSDVGVALGAPSKFKDSSKKKKKKEKNVLGYENQKVMSFDDFTKQKMNTVTKINNIGESYSEGNTVLVEYWYNSMITPVKILEKKGSKYRVTHNVPESKIKNAPEEWIKASDIIDTYKVNESAIINSEFDDYERDAMKLTPLELMKMKDIIPEFDLQGNTLYYTSSDPQNDDTLGIGIRIYKLRDDYYHLALADSNLMEYEEEFYKIDGFKRVLEFLKEVKYFFDNINNGNIIDHMTKQFMK